MQSKTACSSPTICASVQDKPGVSLVRLDTGAYELRVGGLRYVMRNDIGREVCSCALPGSGRCMHLDLLRLYLRQGMGRR